MRGRVAQLALVLLLPTSVRAWATPPAAASQRGLLGLDLVSANTHDWVPQAASVPRAAHPRPTGPAVGALLGSAAALFALVGLQSRGRRHSLRRFAVISTRDPYDGEEVLSFPNYKGQDDLPPGTDERIVTGYAENDGEVQNYINPWEKRLNMTEEQAKVTKIPVGWKFQIYEGPVYKSVPVSEELSFPLDPKVYYEPLEPPPPGRKWGDGRAEDGYFYMYVDGERVQYWQAWGRRKVACSIVKIVKGTGQFIVNGKDAIVYFQNKTYWWVKACEPLAALSQKNNFDIIAKVFGGGISGQAGAIRLALARAMEDYNFEWRPLLRKAKYLTRDWRMVESKKTGQPKARKKTPYHKR